MTVTDLEWSSHEHKIAREVFEKAYRREIAALLEEVRQRAGKLAQIEEMWKFHDFLSARRHDLDGKYDYRDSELIFLFARLVKEGWLQLEELDGLNPDKLTKVAVLARM